MFPHNHSDSDQNDNGESGSQVRKHENFLMTNEFKQEVFTFHTKKNFNKNILFLFIITINTPKRKIPRLL